LDQQEDDPFSVVVSSFEAMPVQIRAVYALGAISQNWNFLEKTMEMLLWRYLNLSPAAGPLVTTHLSNETRNNILRGMLQAVETCDAIKEDVLLAIRCASILVENRNIITHNNITISGEKVTFSRTKTDAGKVTRTLHVTTARALLDMSHAVTLVSEFNQRLYYVIPSPTNDGPRRPAGPLPRRPPQPSKLDHTPSTQTVYPRPQPPSEA